MAKPRIFISSTFYDLRHIREDLERFIKDLGYEPVRNETGSIPYGKDESPETYAYREVELCDIIIAVIGGRFGSESQQDDGSSISQNELRRALERGIQVFIFIEKGVLGEFSTYSLNKERPETRYRFVDNTKIFQFIEELQKLPRNNPIAPFETSADIVAYLQAQWSGLFQRFLQDQKRLSEIRVLEEMKSISSTLQQLVEFLTQERRNSDEAIRNILTANHPAFRLFAKLTKTPYRVFFTNRAELDTWLKVRQWTLVESDAHDENSVAEWAKGSEYLKLVQDIFDDQDRLRIYSEHEWNDDWLTLQIIAAPEDDDVPF
ncbi:MAG: DUF4062 domain-containing protein [Acidobacteriota bacterium]|nr:DUF4062 domain-containing protein [Acidobacteriota bacterium]